MSKNQKLNTKSSIECELLGVDDASPQMLWTRYFLEEQGYSVEASILNQDNIGAILLEEEGRASIGKRTTHINMRYFFIKERISSWEITVKHCPETEILADHLTKPLQGTMFRKFGAEIKVIQIDMCDADLGWDIPCIKNEQEQVGTGPSPQEYVGIRVRAYVGKKKIVVVPTAVPMVGKGDPSTVSKDTVIGVKIGRRAAYPRIPVSLQRGRSTRAL
jgi:hypothetical protein